MGPRSIDLKCSKKDDIHVLALQGTRLKANDTKCNRNEYDKEGYMIFNWGRDPKGNSSTGTLIAINKKYFEFDVYGD